MGTAEGRSSASAASTFSSEDVAELQALAAGLPEGWCLRVEPPHAQLAIVPVLDTRHWHHGCLLVARDGRVGPARVVARNR